MRLVEVLTVNTCHIFGMWRMDFESICCL